MTKNQLISRCSNAFTLIENTGRAISQAQLDKIQDLLASVITHLEESIVPRSRHNSDAAHTGQVMSKWSAAELATLDAVAAGRTRGKAVRELALAAIAHLDSHDR